MAGLVPPFACGCRSLGPVASMPQGPGAPRPRGRQPTRFLPQTQLRVIPASASTHGASMNLRIRLKAASAV